MKGDLALPPRLTPLTATLLCGKVCSARVRYITSGSEPRRGAAPALILHSTTVALCTPTGRHLRPCVVKGAQSQLSAATVHWGVTHASRGRRRWKLEQELQQGQLTEEERREVVDSLEARERDFTRLQRQRMSAADFEPLTLIGRGAFGEVPPPVAY